MPDLEKKDIKERSRECFCVCVEKSLNSLNWWPQLLELVRPGDLGDLSGRHVVLQPAKVLAEGGSVTDVAVDKASKLDAVLHSLAHGHGCRLDRVRVVSSSGGHAIWKMRGRLECAESTAAAPPLPSDVSSWTGRGWQSRSCRWSRAKSCPWSGPPGPLQTPRGCTIFSRLSYELHQPI